MYWNKPNLDQKKVDDFVRLSGLDPILSAFLVTRGVSPENVDSFLNPTLKELCPNPSSFADMDLAIEHIAKALLEKKKISIFADYDVDGATSAAQLIRYFRYFGVEAGLYVPNRLTEGYGPSPEAFQSLKDQGNDLVITVDCGAAAEAALKHAENIDLSIIVLDHHLMSSIPKCLALVNPNRMDCQSGQGHLAAAGVVFVLLIGLNRFFREEAGRATADLPDLRQFLDLCALGTLCDMAPLKGVNRAFVVQGLKIVAQDQSPSLLALSQVSERSPPRRVTDLTFGIGPQLNAGGRIGDPWLATKLLSLDSIEEALPLAEQLNALNQARKIVQSEILDAARLQITTKLQTAPDTKILIAMGEGWHPGVIGIVAGRLKDEFHKPVIVIGFGDEFGTLAKGSARSIPGINIGELISIASKDGILESGGGHAMAGGLSMMPDRLSELETFLAAGCYDEHLAFEDARTVDISLDVIGASLTLDFLDVIERAGPFGASAPKPILRIKRAKVTYVRQVGDNHLKVTLDDGSGAIDGISWNSADQKLGEMMKPGAVLDVIGYCERNSWRGRESVQLEIYDVCENK